MNILESIVLNFLQARVTVPVYTILPANFEVPCIVVEKTAGGYSDTILSATLAVQCYGADLEGAAVLNDDIKWLLLNEFIQEAQVLGIELNSDYNFTDTTTEHFRYQAVYDVRYYRKDE